MICTSWEAAVYRYHDYNHYLKGIFGERVQKISLDAGMTCPNRDGTISTRGCIYCDRRGSGTGAMLDRHLTVEEQILSGMDRARQRYGARKFIAYFQSFTNTYASVEKLRSLYDKALSYPGMVGLSVATRPDCVDGDVIKLLRSYNSDYLVWVELGLQSAHEDTLRRIHRGHGVAAFEQAVSLAVQEGLNVCAHVILGLPGEDRARMQDTARYLGRIRVQGVKIHLLYVLKYTPLAALYENDAFRCLEREEYVDIVVDFLELLPPEMVVHRLTGDPLKEELLAPFWALEKLENLRLIRRRMEERQTWQGKNHRSYIVGTPGMKA